jgi:hypothetical protein
LLLVSAGRLLFVAAVGMPSLRLLLLKLLLASTFVYPTSLALLYPRLRQMVVGRFRPSVHEAHADIFLKSSTCLIDLNPGGLNVSILKANVACNRSSLLLTHHFSIG